MSTATQPDVFAGDDPAVPEPEGQGSKAVATAPEPEAESPAPEPEAESPKDEGSTYFVFRAYKHVEDGALGSSEYLEGEAWVCVGSYVANNGNGAIRKAIRENWSDADGNPTPEADGHYATAPQRSWNPTPVAVKQPPTTLSLGS